MRKLNIFDTTLRDGEQSLGITLNIKEKLEIGRQLVRLGVDVIEAGFPASSPGDMNAVKRIAQEIRGVSVCGLTRAVKADIDICAEALKPAEAPRIHTGLALSPIHMKYKLRLEPEQAAEACVMAVKHAKKYVNDVEFYPEDAFRSDRHFLAGVLERVIASGATVVNIPDTVGYATPWEFGELITFLMNNVRGIENVTVSVHCHNDLGMATANSLAGIKAGATQVEGTINGIGERAGNTSLEEVIMAIYTQRGLYDVKSNIKTQEIMATSRLVSKITGVPIPSHKAIVGSNAFMHASGIHQDGVLKESSTYEIIDPALVGVPRNLIVLSARSGRHALKHRLEELGYSLGSENMNTVYEKFLQLADQKQEVFDEDLHALMGYALVEKNGVNLVSIAVSTSGVSKATATVTLEVDDKTVSDAAIGNGPVDAVFKAVDRLLGKTVTLEDYTIKSISRGSEALGDATVKVRYEGHEAVVGRGISTDIIEASAKAYVNAMSKLKALDEK